MADRETREGAETVICLELADRNPVRLAEWNRDNRAAEIWI